MLLQIVQTEGVTQERTDRDFGWLLVVYFGACCDDRLKNELTDLDVILDPFLADDSDGVYCGSAGVYGVGGTGLKGEY